MDSTTSGFWTTFFTQEMAHGRHGHVGAHWPGDIETGTGSVEASIEAQRASRAVENLENTLGQKVDRLALICRAIWEFVRESNNLSQDALVDKVMEIDMLDGSLDGKVASQPKKCSACGRTLSKRHMRCLYCGSQELLDSAFDAL